MTSNFIDPAWEDVTHLVTDAGIDPYHRRLRVKRKGDKTYFRMEVPDGVQVAGFTPGGKLLAIRETKKDTGESYVHLPSGMVEDPTESFDAAAARELLEETGYGFDRLIRIATCTQGGAHLFGSDVVYVALDCVRQQEPEAGITVIEMTPDNFEEELVNSFLNDPEKSCSGRASLASFRLAMQAVKKNGWLNPRVTEESPLLVIIAGLPLAGKTTLGDALQNRLGIKYVDIDRLREQVTGLLTKEQNDELWKRPDASTIQKRNMRIAYQAMHEGAVNAMLGASRSLIISATYSQKGSQEFLAGLTHKHGAKVKIVLCTIMNPTPEELERRMAREAGGKFVSGCNNWADYQDISARYQSVTTTGVFPKEQILEVDTGQPLDTYLPKVIEFIRG